MNLSAELSPTGDVATPGEPERVARFLMRCVFTMFREDVGLLPDKPVQQALQEFLSEPDEFTAVMPELCRAMDDVAEALDRHREEALARDEKVTMKGGMYNVLEKLRSGEALTAAERHIHEVAVCGVLLDVHEALDRLVGQSYGWPWLLECEEILERLAGAGEAWVDGEGRYNRIEQPVSLRIILLLRRATAPRTGTATISPSGFPETGSLRDGR